MFGQMSPIAPPSQSSMADLRALLELISDPAKMKAALESLAKQAEDLSERQQMLSVKEPEVEGLKKTLEEKEQYLKAWEAELELKAKEILAKAQASAKREKEIEAKEESQAQRFDEVQKSLDEALNVAASREAAARAKIEEASSIGAAAEMMRKEYEDKLGKLKAMVGA